MGAAFEQPVEDGFGQITIMQHLAEGCQRFVRGHEDGPAVQVAVVNDAIEHVGGVGGITLVPEFIDDEHMRMHVRFQGCIERAELGGMRQDPDELIGACEAGVEAVLDGAIGDSDGQVGFAASRGARQDGHCAPR